MTQQVKKKLCWNCEGSVTHTVETCPYCGVYLSPENLKDDPQSQSRAPKELIPKPPYQPEEVVAEELDTSKQEQDGYLIPLVSLMAGAVFAIFGVIIYLFSQDGKLTLTWDSDWGLIFIALAIPLLFIGYRGASKL
ncbi:MAG: hypothetical protein ACK4HV_01000 [Parachlamydiaceae bacterium]